ncbi:hypothetical protein [Amycolatopsis orientalis]|uniref:hypothetical protein n=1 Tax=Amycolatopsis orientalis TaxID=31958 RepID=UPI0004092F02|nr:hypothetical protein [Amycolatopsis orientalis]
MSTLVRYSKDGDDRLIDLAELNPIDYELIKGLRGEINRGDRILLCQQALADDEGAEMFVRLRGGRYWAAHFPGSGCAGQHEIARESDEHRWQKEYWQRAAEDAGYRVTQEYRTGRGTVLDVAIDGPYRTGIEVQRSAIELSLVKARTTKSFGAGWLPVWFLDSDRTPPWFYAVPSLGCNDVRWSTLPERRAATAIGPRTMTPTRCTVSSFGGRCPAGGRAKRTRPKRPCGQWHPEPQPRGGLTVDDVAGMLPSAELVAMRDLLGDVRLVAPKDLKLFQEMTGLTGEYWPGSSRRARGRPAPRTIECASTGHRRGPAPARCWKCGLRPCGEGGVLCGSCRLMIEGRTASDYYAMLPPRP